MKPLPLLPHQVPRRHVATVEEQLAHRRRPPAHLPLELAEVESVPALLHDERRDAARAGVPGPRHHQVGVGVAAVRDETLRAGEPPPAVHGFRPRPQRRRVRPARRLRQRVGAEPLARQHARQIPLLQVLRAEPVDPGGSQVVNGDGHGERQGARSRSPPAPPGTSSSPGRLRRSARRTGCRRPHVPQVVEEVGGELAAPRPARAPRARCAPARTRARRPPPRAVRRTIRSRGPRRPSVAPAPGPIPPGGKDGRPAVILVRPCVCTTRSPGRSRRSSRRTGGP